METDGSVSSRQSSTNRSIVPKLCSACRAANPYQNARNGRSL